MRTLALVMVAACGRIGFGELGAATSDAASSDSVPDASPGFCASQTGLAFCSDFDETGIGEWMATTQVDGSLAIDTEARSAPAALRVDTISFTSNAASVRVKQDVATATRVVASFSVYIDVVGTSDPVLLNLLMDDGANVHNYEVVDRVPPGVMYVEDVNTPSGGSATFSYFDTVSQLSAGLWHRVELRYQSGTGASLQLVVDNNVVLDTPPTYTTAGAVSVHLGVDFLNAPAMPWRMHFDDFALQLQ